MKCLESLTIEQVKEMSHEELAVLWDNVAKEKQAMDIRATVVSMLEVIEAQKTLIES